MQTEELQKVKLPQVCPPGNLMEQVAYKILEYPDPFLTKACLPVSPSSSWYLINQKIERMKILCEANRALGLAANQVGVLERILVYRDNQTELHGLVNPIITNFSEEKSQQMEGCLSFPGLNVGITRSVEITVEALEEIAASKVTLTLRGDEARRVQHELDHLDGKLIVDHLTKLDRHMVIGKWTKKRRQAMRKVRSQSLKNLESLREKVNWKG
jgi:peptide deformylase